MSDTDSFINEVTDEVRRDRLFSLLRRYGWIGLLAVLGIVGGAAYVEWKKHGQSENAQVFGDQLMAALQGDKPEEALAKISVTGGQGAILGFATAAQMVQDGRFDAAVDALRVISQDASLPVHIRDLALYKAVTIGTAMPEAERTAALEALAKPGAPYRLLAVEQQAAARLAVGDRAGALALAQAILADAAATPGLQQRATELIVALGGEPELPASLTTMPQVE